MLQKVQNIHISRDEHHKKNPFRPDNQISEMSKEYNFSLREIEEKAVKWRTEDVKERANTPKEDVRFGRPQESLTERIEGAKYIPEGRENIGSAIWESNTAENSPISRDLESGERLRTHRSNKKVLILDLDQTLIHTIKNPYEVLSTMRGSKISIIRKREKLIKEGGIAFIKRPGLDTFLCTLSPYYDITVFTSATRIYAQKIINQIDPKRKYIRRLMAREDCRRAKQEGGNGYIKGINLLHGNKDKKDIFIIDDLILNWPHDISNLIPIPPFFGNMRDNQLTWIMNYLLYVRYSQDATMVNPLYFNLEEKLIGSDR